MALVVGKQAVQLGITLTDARKMFDVLGRGMEFAYTQKDFHDAEEAVRRGPEADNVAAKQALKVQKILPFHDGDQGEHKLKKMLVLTPAIHPRRYTCLWSSYHAARR